MTTTMDFTKKNGCYSKELLESNQKINTWFEDPSVTRDQFVQNILEVITPAFYNKAKLPEFKRNLLRKRTKLDVCTYCYNVILKAMGLGV